MISNNKTIAHHNTIPSQILKFVSGHESESLTNRHHAGRPFRTATRWSQLSSRISLCDIAESVSTQAHRLYSLHHIK
ncbi:MAG: DUF4372 domain-containing protein [Nitrosomonas sp.]|nr:DUF4372 domain-containing protein [Nitrosomonas sp.]